MTGELQPRDEGNLPAVQDNSPAAILRVAVETGLGADTIEKLAELAWRQQDRDAAQEFAVALTEFQINCPAIGKKKAGGGVTDKGGRAKYYYAPLDAIDKIVRPRLNALGLAFSWNGGVRDGLVFQTCILRHVNGHSESSYFECPADSAAPGMTGQQKHGGADTYARRYSLTAILGLTTTDEDTDGADYTTISPEQVAQIEDMLSESGGSRDRFYTAMGITSVEEIYAGNFRKAMATLKAKGA